MKSHLHGGAGFHLWARVSPGGRIVNMSRDSTSFTADVDGELQLGIYLGMWGDAFGRLDTPAASIFTAIAHRMGTHARICLHAEDEQGILRKPIDFPLAPNTHLTHGKVTRVSSHRCGAAHSARECGGIADSMSMRVA